MFPPWTTPEAAAEILKNGGVVAIPTETVYGLAGNAYDPKALAKIFEAKKRPHFDPLIVHISAIEELSNVALEVPEVAKKLAKAYWPGPMTLVLPKKDCIPDLATSGLPTVAVRFPNHPIAQKIIRLAGVPLAAPSANLFQHVSPTTAQHVAEQLGNVIDGIVDGGSCGVGVESTIISFPEARSGHDRQTLPSAGSALLRSRSKKCQDSFGNSPHRLWKSGIRDSADGEPVRIGRLKRSDCEFVRIHASDGQARCGIDFSGPDSERRFGGRLQRPS